MFITMPIKSFKLEGNKVYVNESVIEYENISNDNREILESMISKGAYGSALLTLNKLYNIKSINESKYTREEYCKYLEECNSLMEECVIETEAHNFRPLINLDGLEIMENANNIARGKGNKLLIEDFRLNEEMSPWMKYQSQIEQIFERAKVEMDEDMFSDFCNAVGDIAKDYEFSYNEDEEYEDFNESVKLKEDYSYIEPTPADYVLEAIDNGILDDKTVCECALKYMSSDDIVDMVKYNDLYVPGITEEETDEEDEEITEECEGTQCSDIAEKKDQEIGSLQKPKKVKKHFNEMFNIPKNHGFKGFRLNEQGYYSRGNYILINENGNIKAINKKLLERLEDNDGPYNQSFKTGSKLDLLLSDLQTALNIGASKIWYEDEDFVKDMCTIEASEDENEENSEYIDVWFLAEVSYMQGTKMVDNYLDDVLKKYDEKAYFEAETTGRWIALVRKNKLDL